MRRGELKKEMMAEIHEQFAAEYYRLARLIVGKIFEISPIWTGAYVASHRVKLAGQFTAPPMSRMEMSGGVTELSGNMGTMRGHSAVGPRPHPSPEVQRSVSKNVQLEKLAKLFRTHRHQFAKRLMVINEAEDAGLVEFIGTLNMPEGKVYIRAADTFRGWRSGYGKAKAAFE
jgi:hypothetical protein